MDFGLLGGILLGIALIVGAISLSGGHLQAFSNLESLLIVLGGTVASTLVHYRREDVKRIWPLLRQALRARSRSPVTTIAALVGLARRARKEGLLGIEGDAEGQEDEFLRAGLQLVVDGFEPELVKNMLEIEIAFLEDRHRQGQQMFEYMGAMAPAFGMIGTLIGLIIMLGNLSDPDAIGPGLAVALITTLYGTLFANLIFIPVAGKLRQLSENEVLVKEIIMEGILSIQQGENPRVLEQKLKSFLPPALRSQPAEADGGLAGEAVTPNVR